MYQKRIRLLCAACFIFGVSVALLMATGAGILLMHHYQSGGLEALARTRSESGNQSNHGPWGNLEAIEIPLANPDGSFPDQEERLKHPRWFFEKFSENTLTRFLSSCDLRAVERRVLLDKRTWQIETNGIGISPPEQLVWSLTHRGRQQIYSTLSKSALNYPQCFAFRFPLKGFDLKFKESGLPVEQLDKVRRLTYTNGSNICFADLEALQKVLMPEEFKDLVSTLYVVPTYLLRLRISEDSDVDALVKYWGRGGREKRIAPILTSLSRVPGGGGVNISYVMPTFARLRLYTYPESWDDPTATKQDCFFTAMNFFNETPDTNFFDGVYCQKVLQNDYEPISEKPLFGDFIALFNESGQAVHVCVYIADDFVFTKNGINPAQPWVIMKVSDMMMIYYPAEYSGRVLFLRRKNFGTAALNR